MPENHARRFFLQVEKIQFLAQATVVTFFRFFKHREVGFEVIFFEPSGAVNALQHFVFGVTPPVGTGHFHELVHLQFTRARHVRAAAKVNEVTLFIKRNRFTFRNRFNELSLIFFTESEEEFDRVFTLHFLANDRDIFSGQLIHALFDGRQIFGRKRTLVGKVIVKTVFDSRSDRHLSIGIEFFDSLSHQVSGRVTNDFERFRILFCDDGQCGVMVNDCGGIHQLIIKTCGNCGFAKARANALGYIGDRHSRFKFSFGTVWKRYE